MEKINAILLIIDKFEDHKKYLILENSDLFEIFNDFPVNEIDMVDLSEYSDITIYNTSFNFEEFLNKFYYYDKDDKFEPMERSIKEIVEKLNDYKLSNFTLDTEKYKSLRIIHLFEDEFHYY